MKPDVRRPLYQTKVSPQIRDTNGHIVRWYNLLIDIDERKCARGCSRGKRA